MAIEIRTGFAGWPVCGGVAVETTFTDRKMATTMIVAKLGPRAHPSYQQNDYFSEIDNEYMLAVNYIS